MSPKGKRRGARDPLLLVGSTRLIHGYYLRKPVESCERHETVPVTRLITKCHSS